ncbi:MAG: GNAT family N-acetyltransferase [Massilibacteroides sp.]|nr:GNAT family N-acetyltransferase [Massilibacteroides sp.]MDD3061655.1 GNAT family N-acetyltransferase [Massilibacteroides sp.]MDD4114302.1 GNAT family N-acetyltransferase [Massilibacteroides sp.]MDD4659961.1 GNAT family N-acetyltransferase [Massilibacteroides sp.]
MFSFKSVSVAEIGVIRDLAFRIWNNTYETILSKEQLGYMFEMMYSEESLRKQMIDLDHRFFMAEVDGVPSGYISIEQKGRRLFNFQKIYALPAQQGKGIGRFLVEQGIAYLKNNYETPLTVELFVNRENKAVGFYKHLGFKVVDTRDHPIGNGFYMNDYIMNLELA